MSYDDDGKVAGFAGGGMLVVVVCIAILKPINELLSLLRRLMNELAGSMESLAMMVWAFAELAIVVVLLAAIVAGAVYVVYRYVKLVRQVAGIRQEFEDRELVLRNDLEAQYAKLEKDVGRRFGQLRSEMETRFEEMGPPVRVAAENEGVEENQVAPTAVLAAGAAAAAPSPTTSPQSATQTKVTPKLDLPAHILAASNPY